ncbi:MAG TPA: O-methyltransferase [Bacillota bacterium]|nr:O-methyltransferase [Bacillota bacterium]
MSDYLENLNSELTHPIIEKLLAQAEMLHTPIVQKDAIRLIIQMIKASDAKHVLEIGSAIGYSAIMMAMFTDAHVTTIERDHDSYERAKKNISDASLDSRITLIESDALLYNMAEDYRCDLLFIDAAKGSYEKFFSKYTPFLKSKGIVICDNLLFHGLVENEDLIQTKNQAKLVDKIRRFNQFLVNQDGFDTHVYDIGDGLSISIKK